jgi:putative methionine-R-sulfoxide reductase with GAF domain
MFANHRKDEINLSLAEMISTGNLEEQCFRISNWLKVHYPLDGIGFFFKEPETTRAHFFTETISKNIVHNLEEMLISVNPTEAANQEALFFAKKEGRFVAFSSPENPDTLEPMGLIFSLGALGDSTGTLVLLPDSENIQDFTSNTPAEFSFVPLISSLLQNTLSHEHKDTKIRMLNLYQTVSSSLVYISDLQELLTTITGIVTSELLCEESSVLLYDEENNEFEFFTAFGETGMTLVAERFPADKGIAGRALRERKTQVVNDVQSDPDFYGNIDEEHDFKTKSILAAPLIAGEESVGVLNAINKIETKFFDKNDDQILSAIADEIALAVKHARLFEYVVENYCKIKQGKNSCRDCKRPLKTWTPCARHLGLL